MGAWPSILVTGGDGVIGGVLMGSWRGPATSFDLPEGDARDLDALTQAVEGHDVVVHLAWDTKTENFRNGGFDPANLRMAVNAAEAAIAGGASRIIFASSVHADAFSPPPARRLDPSSTPVPDSPYGASKVFTEALARHTASHRGLPSVAIRFGGVNAADRRPAEDASERAVWLSHEDCVSLVHLAATTELKGGYGLLVGVSDSAERVHDYSPDFSWPT